jgi:hypothetical protein
MGMGNEVGARAPQGKWALPLQSPHPAIVRTEIYPRRASPMPIGLVIIINNWDGLLMEIPPSPSSRRNQHCGRGNLACDLSSLPFMLPLGMHSFVLG